MFAEFFNLFQSHHVGQLQVSKEGFFWVVILKNILRRTQWDPTVLVIWQWWYRSSSTFGKKFMCSLYLDQIMGRCCGRKTVLLHWDFNLYTKSLRSTAASKSYSKSFLKPFIHYVNNKWFKAYYKHVLSVFCQLETKGKLQRKRIHSSLQSASA